MKLEKAVAAISTILRESSLKALKQLLSFYLFNHVCNAKAPTEFSKMTQNGYDESVIAMLNWVI